MENERFQKSDFRISAENRKNELIDTAIVNFEGEYSKIYRDVKSKVTLFASDFNVPYSDDIILLKKPVVLTVQYQQIFKYFEQIFKDDVLGESISQRIKKSPPLNSETTFFLSEFVNNNTNRDHEQLDVLQSQYNLRQTSDGSAVVMTIDRYIMPEIKRIIPVAEIWTLRKYKRSDINSNNINNSLTLKLPVINK